MAVSIPSLTTSRLNLRPFALSDAEPLHRILSQANILQYFPGSTQRFSIVHYLKSLLPYYSPGKYSILMFRLEPTGPAVAILSLFLITAVFLGLACLVFSLKEYMFED